MQESGREIFHPENKSLNFGRQKAVDMRQNPRIYLPKARPPNEEAKLEAKEQAYLDTWMAYKQSHCTPKGEQIESNLTKSEQRGEVKLSAIVQKGEIIISETDKSQQFSVSTPESYYAEGDKHTPGDEKINFRCVCDTSQDIKKCVYLTY